MKKDTVFTFEELIVWQKAVVFADAILALCENIHANQKPRRILENLEAAAVSIPANIAEGKGRFSKKEFVQFLFIARGSLFEAVTVLTVFHRRKWITDEELSGSRLDAEELSKMISSLIYSIRKSG